MYSTVLLMGCVDVSVSIRLIDNEKVMHRRRVLIHPSNSKNRSNCVDRSFGP